MNWNYRLFKQDTPKSADGSHMYFVGECYYDDTGKPEAHSTTEHNHVIGDSIDETKEVYKMIGEAFNAPVVKLDANGNFKDVQ